MKKTIMVTGGTGYIGAHVVKKLLKKGHHVRLTVRDKNKTQKFQFLQEIADNSPGELEIFQADLIEKSIRELGINYTPIEKSIGEMVDKLDPKPNSASSKIE